jgi:hypothetical protein
MKEILLLLLTGDTWSYSFTSCSFPKITFVVMETTLPFLRCLTTWAYLSSGGAWVSVSEDVPFAVVTLAASF